MKKRVLSAVMTAAAMLLGAMPYTVVPAAAEPLRASADYSFDELMAMRAEEFSALSDTGGCLTQIEALQENYDVKMGILGGMLTMQSAETAAGLLETETVPVVSADGKTVYWEQYLSEKTADLLRIPESMISIDSPSGEYYDANDVNITDRMIELEICLTDYGFEPECKARAYYLSMKRIQECTAVSDFTPWQYGGQQHSETETLSIPEILDAFIAEKGYAARTEPTVIEGFAVIFDRQPEGAEEFDTAAITQEFENLCRENDIPFSLVEILFPSSAPSGECLRAYELLKQFAAEQKAAEQEFAFLDPTEQAFCERVAGWENAELDDCIPLRRESGELQLLTPQKPYEIDLIRQGRYRIYLSGDSLPDADLVLDRWKDMLRAVNYPEKTMERWTCSFTPADGGYDVSCGQEAYLGVSLVDCLKSFPEVRSIDAQFGYMTEDRPNEAYDFFFNFRYSAGTPEPDGFPGLDVAAVRQKGLWEEGCDLELQDSSYAAYFAAVPNLQANQFVSDLHISYITTELADENDDAKMSLPERTILWRRGDPETCLSEFFELPLNEIGEMFPRCPKGGDQIIIGITHAQLERLMDELEPEMERIGKDAGLFKDAFFGLLMEKLHLNGIYETFDPDYFEASLPSAWLLQRYPFTLRECDEWEEDAACMVTLRYHYPYGPDGAIDSLSLEHEGQCITISTDAKEQIPDALYELTLRSLYVINKYGDRDYFTDAFTEGGPVISDEGQPETPEITDVEQMREMLNAYVEENQIDARIVSNKEYPGYQPIVVEYDGDRAPDAWNTVFAYIDEQKMDRTKIGMVRIENGVAVTTVNCSVTIAQSGDVDCNGQTTIADAVLLARYLAEDPVEVSAQGLLNAELDGNPDSLDAGDFAKLLQIIAGCADA